MTRYSTSDLSRKSGEIIAEALRRPVTITQIARRASMRGVNRQR